MKLQDVYYSIDEEIFKFQYNHNGAMPQCIFMSNALCKYISSNEELLYSINADVETFGRYRGIKIKTYDYPEPEYYLAEGPGMFKKYYEDTKVVLYTED